MLLNCAEMRMSIFYKFSFALLTERQGLKKAFLEIRTM